MNKPMEGKWKFYLGRLTNKCRRNEGTRKSPFGRICSVLKLVGKFDDDGIFMI